MPEDIMTPKASFTDFNFDVNKLYEALSNRFESMTSQQSIGNSAAIGEDAINGLRMAAQKFGGIQKVNLSQIKPKVQKVTRVKGVNTYGNR